jgi:uncharacterized membrane protein YsdA (DUF1294 family)
LGWGVWAGRLPLWSLGAAAAINLLTFVTYAMDKSAAQSGRWRTPEKHLHLLSLAGGWAGAWCAQQWLRHKSSKRSSAPCTGPRWCCIAQRWRHGSADGFDGSHRDAFILIAISA